MDESVIVVLCTFPSAEEAKRIAKILVEKKLAACCNIINNIDSIYRWKDKIEETQEVFLLIKTAEKKYEILEKEIKMHHSYSVPEIIAIGVRDGSNAYIDWIFESTSGRN